MCVDCISEPADFAAATAAADDDVDDDDDDDEPVIRVRNKVTYHIIGGLSYGGSNRLHSFYFIRVSVLPV